MKFLLQYDIRKQNPALSHRQVVGEDHLFGVNIKKFHRYNNPTLSDQEMHYLPLDDSSIAHL